MRSRNRDLRRNPARRQPKRKFYLFCEGENTEPAYFEQLRRSLPGTIIDIEIVKGVGEPFTIAQKACSVLGELVRQRKRSRNSFEESDEVWAVFDRDDHPKFDEAIKFCIQKSVFVAYSNPCFEVWLVLHLQDYERPDDRFEVQRLLRKLRPEYHPGKRKMPDCAALMAFVEIAERRAATQLQRREEEGLPFGRPSTKVGELTHRLRAAARASLGC